MKIILGAIVGGILVFGCGFVIWVVIDMHGDKIHDLPDDAAFAAAVAKVEKEGMYWTPSAPEGEDPMSHKPTMEKMKKGPVAFMALVPKGTDPEGKMYLVKGFAIAVLSSLIASILLAAAGIGSFVGRWLFVVGLGVFTTIFGDVSYWNYFHFAQDYTMSIAIDHMATWGVAGIGIAAVVKPSS